MPHLLFMVLLIQNAYAILDEVYYFFYNILVYSQSVEVFSHLGFEMFIEPLILTQNRPNVALQCLWLRCLSVPLSLSLS